MGQQERAKGTQLGNYVGGEMSNLREAAPTVVEPDLFTTDIVPRPLKYPLADYHKAMSEGPLHYTWQDKPHRLVYDLIAAVRYYAHPPRTALTDAQLLDILQSLDACTARLPGGFRLFARAVEAAHGIGKAVTP
jgi:hypothetical protein